MGMSKPKVDNRPTLVRTSMREKGCLLLWMKKRGFADHDTIPHHSLQVIEDCPVCGVRDCPPGAHAQNQAKVRVAKTGALD
jgi:hypothetical protein